MSAQKLSVSEIRAVAEAAINARHSADAAKKAYEECTDDSQKESLKQAWETAETAATDAKKKADDLSQQESKTPEQIAKLKRKRAIIEAQLRNAGALDDIDDDDDEEDEDDDSKPLTVGAFKRMRVGEATQSATEMANAIQDAAARQSVLDALKRVVPSGDAQKDFQDAVSIANREKNSKVLEEISRRPMTPRAPSNSGAPGRPQEIEQDLTAEEMQYTKPPFNLSKKEILAARPQNQ